MAHASGANWGNYPQRLNFYRKHWIGNSAGHIGPFQPLPDRTDRGELRDDSVRSDPDRRSAE